MGSTEAEKRDSRTLMAAAYRNGTAIPAFNIPYLPMMQPVIAALVDCNCLGFVEVALCEWQRFGAHSQEQILNEYSKFCRPQWVRLHQDHVPAIDEDGHYVDCIGILKRALELGYDSIMVDGSRLPLERNIAVTRQVVALAGDYNVPVEGELGAVLGHESGPLPDYEELFSSGRGFTDVEQARLFLRETKVDWISVACGNIHGAIQGQARHAKKAIARLNIHHLAALNRALGIPLVLHGGSGIEPENLRDAFRNGIAKINIGTDLRQPFEQAQQQELPISKTQQIIYDNACRIIRDNLGLADSREIINP